MYSNLFSHPNRLLEEHTTQVVELANKFYSNLPVNENTLRDILTITAFSHDIGKSTQFFQEYITGNKSLKNKPETKHALLGGIIGVHLTDRYLKFRGIDNPFLLSLSFILPRRHHSNLKDFLDDLSIEEQDIQLLNKQIKSIDKQKLRKFLENVEVYDKSLIDFSLEDIDLYQIKQNLRKVKRFIRKLKDQKSLSYYIDTILLFSLLLDADKSDVGIKTGKDILFKDISISPEIVDDFVKNLSSLAPINKLRETAYKEVSGKDIDINQKIYTLTLPTGLGKTLISFKTALKIAEKVKKEKNQDLKIIYCLPFLSIIEQNYNVIEKVLKNADIKPDSSIILKHHHLTGFRYTEKENEFDYDTSRILIEGWNSKIITTTFIQFFYSLIGNRNKMLRKFHKFANSIVILDEIQSIPHKYWLLLREVLTEMTERFNFYLIFSTATQPFILEKGNFFELAQYKPYFEKLNRYTIKINKKEQSVEEFYSSLNLVREKRYLFIMNTVSSAKELYSYLKKDFENEMIFLSTHIIPKHRLERIKKLKSKEKRIAVSTQLVEAGVDIDFDVVYRDFAPFDSLNQSAGRCNREGKIKKGEFFVIRLKDENGRHYSSYIYDTVLLSITDEILQKSSYEEREILELVENYYYKLSRRKSDKESIDLLEMLYSLKFSGEKEKNQIKSIQDFVLIEEDMYKEDVFIEIDEEAKEVWKEFSKIWKLPDIFQRKQAFDSIKADFYKFVVSVPIKDNQPPIENNFYYVPYENLNDYYDLETGFKQKGELYFEF